MQVNKLTKKYLLVFLVLNFWGCTEIRSPEYLQAARTEAPQPVYNRVFMARPPQVLPSTKNIENKGSPVDPVFQLEASDETVENVVRQLGKAARYRTYTAASVADIKISIESLGTIQELTDTISSAAGVYISVDSANRELRVLPPKRNKK
jgi:hypothetical protein